MDAPATLAAIATALSVAAAQADDLGDADTLDALHAALDGLCTTSCDLAEAVGEIETAASYRNGCRHANDPSNAGLDAFDERDIAAAERRALAEVRRIVEVLANGPVRDEALALLGVQAPVEMKEAA